MPFSLPTNVNDVLRKVLLCWITIGLFVFFSLWFWTPTQNFQNEAVNYLLLLPALFYALAHPRVFLDFMQNRALQLLAVLMIYLALTSLWGDHPEEAGKLMKRNFYTAMFIFSIFVIFSHLGAKPLQHAMLFGTVAAAASYVFGAIIVGEKAYTGSQYTGWFGDGTHPNFTGAAYGAMVVYGVVYCRLHLRMNSAWPILSMAAVAINFVALFDTASRGALLSTIAAIAIQVLYLRRWHVITSAGLMGITVIALWALRDPIGQLITRGDAGRVEIWTQYVNAGLQSPLFGRGAGSEIVAHWQGIPIVTPHNIFLSTFVDGGIVGVTLLIALLVFAVVKTSFLAAQSSISSHAFALLVFTIVSRTFESKGFFSLPSDFWFYGWLGLAFAICSTSTPSSEKAGQTTTTSGQ